MPQRIDKRAHLYQLPDGKTALFRTCNARQLMGRWQSLFMRNPDYHRQRHAQGGEQDRQRRRCVPDPDRRGAPSLVDCAGSTGWQTLPPITNRPDDDLEVLHFGPRHRWSCRIRFESKNATPPSGQDYLLPNCRLVECRAASVSVSDGVLMTSPTREGLVELLRPAGRDVVAVEFE